MFTKGREMTRSEFFIQQIYSVQFKVIFSCNTMISRLLSRFALCVPCVYSETLQAENQIVLAYTVRHSKYEETYTVFSHNNDQDQNNTRLHQQVISKGGCYCCLRFLFKSKIGYLVTDREPGTVSRWLTQTSLE